MPKPVARCSGTWPRRVLTGFQGFVEELRSYLEIPEEVALAAAITLGVPAGSHGPVRRRPLSNLVFADTWGEAAPWAHDPRTAVLQSRFDLRNESAKNEPMRAPTDNAASNATAMSC